MPMHVSGLAIAGIASGLMVFTQSCSVADEIKLPKASSALFASAKALTASASEFVQMERATDRLRIIRSELAKRLLNANATSKIALDDLIDERKLLCDTRVSHLATVARANYMSSVVSQADEIGKQTKPDNVLSALQLLFAKYAIDASGKSFDPATLKVLGDKTRLRCETDIKGFDIAYYGVAIRPPIAPAADDVSPSADVAASALSLLGPFGALIDTFLGIINPVIIGGATIIDAAERERAIQDFLNNPTNQKNLKEVGEKLGKAASSFNWDKRLQLAASFVEGVRVIQKTELDLSKFDECKDLSSVNLGRTASGAPSTAFMRCWRKSWSQIDTVVATTLKAAVEYDLLADAGDTDAPLTAYQKVTADLNAVSTNAITNPDVLWMFVAQVIGFASTVQTAFSQENKEKLSKAIDNLVKGP